jgi:hypothetical protein
MLRALSRAGGNHLDLQPVTGLVRAEIEPMLPEGLSRLSALRGNQPFGKAS